MKYLTIDQVESIVGFKRAKIYRLIKAKKFPKQYRPIDGSIAVRWMEAEILNWMSGSDKDGDPAERFTESLMTLFGAYQKTVGTDTLIAITRSVCMVEACRIEKPD